MMLGKKQFFTSSATWNTCSANRGGALNWGTLSRRISFCTFTNSIRVIIAFMPDQYVTKGTANLNSLNLLGMLQLRFGEIKYALGKISASADIAREVFFDFQKFLYEKAAA